MREFRRIIQDKRFLIVILLVLLVNGILEYNEMKPNEEGLAYTESLYGENSDEISERIREELESQYSDLSVEDKVSSLQIIYDEYRKARDDFWSLSMSQWDGISEVPSPDAYDYTLTEEERIYYGVVSGMISDYSYVLGYKDTIQGILDRADRQMEDTTIFRKDSFAGRNIVKTKADYQKILEVTPQLSSQYSYELLFNYNISDFIMIAAVLAVVLIVLDERKKGLWEFTYSMPGGRIKLAASRIAVMIIASVITAVLVYIENIIITGAMGDGYGTLSIPIQSVQVCEKVTLSVSIGQYLLIILLWKILVLAFVGLFFMGLALLLKGYLKVFFIGAIVLIAEYIAYDGIDMHSKYSMFKYINIFAWFDSEWCMRNYLNLNLFGYPVNIYTTMCVAVPVLLLIATGLIILSGRVRPFSIRQGKMKKLMNKAIVRIKPYRHENMLITECYKQFFVQRIWIILLLAILLGVKFYDGEEIGYSYKGTLYQRYMEMITGSVTEEKRDYMESELKIWQEKYIELEEILANTDGMTTSEITAAQSRQEQCAIAIECVSELITEIDRLFEEKENGADVKIVNMVSYRYLIGEESQERNMLDAMIILTLSVLVASVILCSENTMNVRSFIRSTKHGRRKFMACKYAVLFIEELIIFIPIIVSTILTVNMKYKITWLNASIRSIEFASDFPFDISIGMAIVIEYIIMFLILYAVMVFAMFISSRMKNITAAVVLSMAVIVMPAALYYIGFSGVSGLTVLNELVVSSWIF